MRVLPKFFALALLWLPLAALAVPQNPETLVKETTDRMLSALKAEKQNIEKEPARVYALVSEIVLPHFDFRKMAQLVLAQSWRDASDEQKARFTEEFRSLLVRTYATSLVDYTDQEVNFLPMRGDPSKDRRVMIRAEVSKPGTPQPVAIETEMYLDDQGSWKVFNVNIEGISLVTNYRSSFAEEIRKGGLDSLIQSLANKTEKANQSSHP